MLYYSAFFNGSAAGGAEGWLARWPAASSWRRYRLARAVMRVLSMRLWSRFSFMWLAFARMGDVGWDCMLGTGA